jgi:hypothetical protein
LKPGTRTNHTLIGHNQAEYYKLAYRFDFLPQNYESPGLVSQITDLNVTLFRVVRYQFYSLVNLATGLDQIPGPPEVLPSLQLKSDPNFEGMKPPILDADKVSIDQVQDFYQIAGNIPVILVNEPIQVVKDVPNSNIYYNLNFPRWVYDQYRKYVRDAATQNHLTYLDLWNIFPPGYYATTPLHLIPQGETELAKRIALHIIQGCP